MVESVVKRESRARRKTIIKVIIRGKAQPKSHLRTNFAEFRS